MIALWGVLVGAFCIIGIARIVRDIHNACNADEEIKRAISEGEIDNFSGEYGKDPIDIS